MVAIAALSSIVHGTDAEGTYHTECERNSLQPLSESTRCLTDIRTKPKKSDYLFILHFLNLGLSEKVLSFGLTSCEEAK